VSAAHRPPVPVKHDRQDVAEDVSQALGATHRFRSIDAKKVRDCSVESPGCADRIIEVIRDRCRPSASLGVLRHQRTPKSERSIPSGCAGTARPRSRSPFSSAWRMTARQLPSRRGRGSSSAHISSSSARSFLSVHVSNRRHSGPLGVQGAQRGSTGGGDGHHRQAGKPIQRTRQATQDVRDLGCSCSYLLGVSETTGEVRASPVRRRARSLFGRIRRWHGRW